LVEGSTEFGEGLGTAFRGVKGEQAFQDREPDQSGPPQVATRSDYITGLLQQPISEGWNNPDWWAANLAFSTAKDYPRTGLSLLGAGIGSVIEPGGLTVAGAAAGYGLGTLFQTLAPAYQRARAEGLDHEAAVDRALKETAIDTAFGALLGAVPGVSVFGKTAEGAVRRPISELLAQIFAVQPGITIAQDATTHAFEGKPVTVDDLISAYVGGMGAGAVLGGTQTALRRWHPSIWWGLPIVRGREAELKLSRNLPDGFPVIDVHDPATGAVTSIKSIDLRAAGYRNRPGSVYSRLSRAIDDLAGFEYGKHGGQKVEEGSITSRTLLVAVPKFRTDRQQAAINRVIQYGAQKGVTVIMRVLR
jgi:hypothetical protein